MAKSIQAALLSADPALVSVLQQATSKLSIELVELDDALRFIDLISQEPFDVMVLDLRGSPAAKHLVATIHQASANREAILMIASDQQDPGAIRDLPKHVSLAMPLTFEQAEQHLQAALPIIEERHRHYDRHPVEMDVRVVCEAKNWQLQAKGVNLSEGGMRLQLPQVVDLGMEDPVRISFELPDGGKIEAPAGLAWINNDLLAGFRFKTLTPANSARLSAWLDTHAAPLPGAARKEIVASWLAKHGKESGTVVISAELRKQLLPQPPAAAAAAQPAAPQPATADALSTQPPSSAKPAGKIGWRTVISFFVGIVIGLLLFEVLHLLFKG